MLIHLSSSISLHSYVRHDCLGPKQACLIFNNIVSFLSLWLTEASSLLPLQRVLEVSLPIYKREAAKPTSLGSH